MKLRPPPAMSSLPWRYGWAARLDERERAIAEREASLDKRAQWLDQQQARVFRMSVQRYHALQALDDQAVLRMQAILTLWARTDAVIRMKSCDDEAIVKMRRRASALKEIVISEQSYIRSLQVLLMEFLVPIVEGGVLKDDEHMGVSFIIGQVLSVNKQFHVAMQKKYAQWPTKHSFAEVFLEHIPLMKKAYANYIAVFDHITSVLLDHSNKKKSPLSAFLEEKMTKGGLDLKAYLIMPVQRLPRYEILLTELIKNTFPEHSDYEQLQKALAKVKKMNSYVDLKKREIDIKKEFLQIQQRQEKKVDHYIKQGKDMTLTTFSDLRELLTNKKVRANPFNEKLVIHSRN
ncbi:RhoGEF domain containing protein [Acanthamoeba castellanii str. Neff]|uniref:RhoGEF domain containing protein n=1 Tax=Acanthamoeba castellanii (strain ATCC 30010 / Neff) TaxID=1257118 RepID=L8GMN5_ACACF|nr:RhoGEF domain containing protein [Acanthamoeba castellanii str. Neff]ELR14330.1 RhoGEF domain containing protein [Acanthamoeba castellanii str. Neff]